MKTQSNLEATHTTERVFWGTGRLSIDLNGSEQADQAIIGSKRP